MDEYDIDPWKDDYRDDERIEIMVPTDLKDFLANKKNWGYFRTLMTQHISYDDRDRIEGVEHHLWHLVEDIRKLEENTQQLQKVMIQIAERLQLVGIISE